MSISSSENSGLYIISPEANKETGDILYRAKNSAGQIMCLEFQKDAFSSLIYWNIAFWVGKRRDGFCWMERTGKDGLRTLLWAKGCIRNFIDGREGEIEFEKEAWGSSAYTHHILVRWDDGHRRNAYKRGLEDLGFRLARVEGRMCLLKTLDGKARKREA